MIFILIIEKSGFDKAMLEARIVKRIEKFCLDVINYKNHVAKKCHIKIVGNIWEFGSFL